MERSTLVQMVIMFAVLFAFGFVVGNNVDMRPSITITETNTTPENYLEKTSIMLKPESVIYQAYKNNDSKKWKTSYKYVYTIQEENKFFSRVKYLKYHKDDAVDRKLIFSNQLPDPQLFVILQK